MTPAATPTASARTRNRSATAVLPARAASAVRNTPARKTHVVAARHPPTIDVGFIHDPMRSPYPSAGIRPDAMAPAAAPRKNGVITDEAAKIAPKRRAWGKVSEYLRNANVAPRKTIPASAATSGMKRVVVAAANVAGKPVHHITRM